jgi:hypothetical protein
MIIPFGTQSYVHRSKPLSAQRMVNCYLEVAPPAAKTAAAVVPSYGIESFATVGTGPMRGGCVVDGVPFVVSGQSLYRISSSGTATSLGTIPNLDDVTMMGDGINVIVVTNTDGYVYDGSSVSQITDSDFPGADWVLYFDGYAVIAEPNSGRIYIAGPLDPKNWNALDFATAEGAPDDILWGVVDHRELFLFGRESIEVWYNSGNADFPFERVPSGFIEQGIMSKWAAGKCDNSVYFLGNDCIAYRLEGYTPVRVSHHAFEQAVEGYSNKTCRVIPFVEGGHKMVAFRFADACWVYDISTQLWHERQSYGYDTWRGKFVLHAYDSYLVADSESASLGKLSGDTFTEFGGILRTECTSPAIWDQNRLISHSLLELCFESGVGLQTGQGSNPLVMLQFSDDGGRTWSSERTASLGEIGEYKTRVRFTRLGASRDRVYRFALSDPVRRTMTNAVLNP